MITNDTGRQAWEVGKEREVIHSIFLLVWNSANTEEVRENREAEEEQ